jgi:photosystem II stability/assembly factor-like uncharacterized protein
VDTRRATRGLLAQAILCSLLLALHAEPSYADWTQTSGPTGGTIRSLLTLPNGASGNRLYTGQPYVWRTDDNGASWTRLDNGLTDPNAPALIAVPDGSGGNDLLVGTNGGVFRSTDDGASWSPINNGISNLSIYALASGPNGSGGTNLYAGAFLGDLYRSTNDGASWTALAGVPYGYNVNALTTGAPGTVLAGTMNGIYRSTDFGATWTRVFTLYGFGFARHGTTLYAATSSGVYRSTNDGVTWNPINTGMNFTWVRAVAAVPNGSGVALFAAAGGVMRSTDNGATWTPVNNGLTTISVFALTTAPNAGGGTDLYAGTGEGVFRSGNLGDSWVDMSFVYSGVRKLEVTPTGRVLAGTENDIFRTDNLGETWTDTQSGTIALDFATNLQGTSGVSLFACNSPAGIYKSTDDGSTWAASTNGLGDFDVNSIGAVPNGSGGTNLLAGACTELYISTDDGAFWQPANLQTLILDYVVAPDGSGGQNIWAGGYGGVWLSTNGGTAWTPRNAGLEDKIVQGIAATAQGRYTFVAVDPYGVYHSTDGGLTWSPANSHLYDNHIVTLLSPDGTNLFAGGAGGVYLSTDHGRSWSNVSAGLTTGVLSLALSKDGSTLLAGTTSFGVWKRPLAEMLGTVAVEPGAGSALALRPNYPNPFDTGTTFQYSLPRAMPVRLVIYDVAGRAVRTLVDGIEGPGERQAMWDGRDEAGSPVGAGMYVYRLEADGVRLARKMARLR